MSTDAKFKVQIMQKDKPLKIPKEVTQALKGAASPKAMGRMKKEAIFCPVANEEKPFLWCFACKSFLRRVTGVVDCAGGPAELDV
ncbi:MAG: hypothetical protein HYU02_04720 [Thaumarchaeota archaeon]|nr:hypothetical protein [Nitrososphaerota archaeon]